MIAIEERDEGVILPVRARAGGKRNAIQGVHDGMLKVSVTTAPEKGKANVAIVTVLCEQLGLKKSQIDLIAGTTSPQKRFLITGISREELESRISH